jgi:hypothetical protein
MNFVRVKNVFSNEEIELLLDKWESIPILHQSNRKWDTLSKGKTEIKSHNRKVEIVGIPDGEIKFLSEKIRDVFSFVLEGEFGIEGPHYFTKYNVGGFHKPHTDLGTVNEVERNKVITIQLNDDYEGGELIIGGEIAPKDKGSVIIYKGDMTHGVTKVTRGERFVITECAGVILKSY